MKQSTVWEIEELAHRAMGKTQKQAENAINDDADIYHEVEERYGIDFESYCDIIHDLLPFTQPTKAGISGKMFHGFVDVAESRFIVKIPTEANTA